MILIADSGSTKTDWVLVDENKKQSSYNTIGYNPYFVNSDAIYSSVSEKLIPQFESHKIKKVIFYGAGCSTNANINIVAKALARCFSKAEIKVEHDMLAAAHALLYNQPGFAAILGTGSNTCLYNGTEVVKNIDSLGYLLGDEGSGSYIAKKIIRDYMRNSMPLDLERKFKKKYELTNSEIFDSLYTKILPNRFLASFCKFADEHKENEYIQNIVKESFNDFFVNLVCHYPEYQKYSFNCVGSVGFVFKDQLKDVVAYYNMELGNILSSPINNLVDYHLKF